MKVCEQPFLCGVDDGLNLVLKPNNLELTADELVAGHHWLGCGLITIYKDNAISIKSYNPVFFKGTCSASFFRHKLDGIFILLIICIMYRIIDNVYWHNCPLVQFFLAQLMNISGLSLVTDVV